jgi:repressor LexA
MKRGTINQDFVRRCKIIIDEREETLEEIGKTIGISKGIMSKYLNGIHLPNINVLKSLSEHWNVSADYLLGLSERRKIK